MTHQIKYVLGSDCGSVGRAVPSDTRNLRFESCHQQTFIKHLFTVNCVEKTKGRESSNSSLIMFQLTYPEIKILRNCAKRFFVPFNFSKNEIVKLESPEQLKENILF